MKKQEQRERPSYPLEKKPGLHGEGFEASHPAFGIIEINRVQGRFDNLAGVDFPQGHAVALRLKGARMIRRYGDTSWYDERLVTEVYMSEVQFAQAISSLNSAERVPVTFRYYPEGKLFDPGEPPVHMADIDSMGDEVVETFDDGLAALKQAMDSFKDPKFSKKTARELVEKAYREIAQNRPFMEEQSRKTIRKAADRAKMEVTAFAQNVVRQFGLQKLGADKGLLMELPSAPSETSAIEHHEEND